MQCELFYGTLLLLPASRRNLVLPNAYSRWSIDHKLGGVSIPCSYGTCYYLMIWNWYTELADCRLLCCVGQATHLAIKETTDSNTVCGCCTFGVGRAVDSPRFRRLHLLLRIFFLQFVSAYIVIHRRWAAPLFPVDFLQYLSAATTVEPPTICLELREKTGLFPTSHNILPTGRV